MFVNVTDSQFFVIVTYWPAYEDNSRVALSARITAGIIYSYLVSSLIAADNLVVTHFIMMKHKLENLTKHFENIREEFLLPDTSTSEFKRAILDGIILHNKVTRYCRLFYWYCKVY